MIEKIKRVMLIKKATRHLGGFGSIKYVTGLPKQGGIKLMRTVKPTTEIFTRTNPSSQYIKDFWSSSDCNMDDTLYARVIHTKINH